MIKEFHDKIEVITTNMEELHANEIVSLVIMKKSYKKKINRFGETNVDSFLDDSMRQYKRKLRSDRCRSSLINGENQHERRKSLRFADIIAGEENV